ncbi:hypothetical protein F5I97DRAFT_1926721 [Phlebopus sp. FC_14]|nr:hypothetical protein F5I97DRAFT_1926721 [Phlebopus sp. FC_14]
MDGRNFTDPSLRQAVFESHNVVMSEGDKYQRNIWLSLTMIPNYVALLSASFLILRCFTRLKTFHKLWRLVRGNKTNFEPSAALGTEAHAIPAPASFFAGAKKFYDLHGGARIYAFRLARLVACMAYSVLTVTTFVIEEQRGGFSGSSIGSPLSFSALEWAQFSYCLTAAYTVLLSLFAVMTPLRWNGTLSAHLTTVLLVLFGVCAYRNIWPLLTYTQYPLDSHEGALLWGKVASLTLGAIVCPLFSPRLYVPFDTESPSSTPSPEHTASWASLLLYVWVDPTIRLGYRMEHLPSDLLPPLSDQDYAKNLKQQSFHYLDEFCGAKRRHIFFGLIDAFRKEYIVLAAMIFLQVIASLAAPVGMSYLLEYIESDGRDSIVRPWVWILWIFLGPVINSLAAQWYMFISTRCMVRAEGILSQLVFEHALRVRTKAEMEDSPATSGGTSTPGNPTSKPKAKGKNLVGKINNLVTSDLGNTTDARDSLMIVLYTPLQLAFCIWFLYTILEWSALVGLAVMVITSPLPGLIAKKAQSVQRRKMINMDARVQTVTETMSVLRMIKLFGWESQIDSRIKEKREEELRWTWKSKIIDLMNSNLNFCIPLLTMLACYATYTLVMGKDLNASKVFSSISVFDILRNQIRTTLSQLPRLMQGKVSLDRINEFLKETELLDHFSKPRPEPRLDALPETHEEEPDLIGFRDASFTWSSEANDDGTLTPSKRQFTLTIEGELYFKPGCINLVIGPTGSGKTSMLMALLGEMHWSPSGPNSWYNLPRKDGVAYAAQESWVQNETIRDNILFGAPYDEVRYRKVLHQCALEKDLALFEAGDDTEVGEKGLTLSGGQKARVTLARAVYSSARILLLDDVLAALDAHTTKWIVQKCLAGDLVRGRTVILVTHNVAIAHSIAHFVVSLGANGRIDSQGTISGALANDAKLAANMVDEQEPSEIKSQVTDSQDIRKSEGAQNGKLVMTEEISVGRVPWSAFRMYLVAMGGKHQLVFWSSFLGLLAISSLTGRVQTWFLGYWATQYEDQPDGAVNAVFYLSGYTVLLVFATVTYSAGYFVYYAGSMRASSSIHRKLVLAILGTTLRWLDTTPTSRVIARCTQDIRAIDGPLVISLAWFLELSLSMLTSLGAIVVITPAFLIPGIIVGILGSWIGRLYMKSQLSVRRELSNAKAPVLGHIGAAISGLASIRAYGAQEAFIQESLSRIDKYTKPARMYYSLNRWMSVRVDMLGALFSSTLATYLVYGPDAHRAANIGFSLNMAVGFSSLILWWIRFLNEVEVSGSYTALLPCIEFISDLARTGNSLERIDSYTNIEQEPKSSEEGKPPAYWPSSGDLRAENLSARYSPDGPKVLHDLSFHINSGERVGIVGRTGSGKSSLTLALLRCIFTEGCVYFDGIPTTSINLDALRSNVAIIPQIPELLSGTLRRNLDPFGQHDDATLNDALRTAGLYAIQDESDDSKLTLDSLIASGGGNLSVGQRQILALARAMVQGSKLLILDEATSAIDHKTDAIIQSSLRNELNSATQLIVAHRLHTIMDADKIMVLDAGRISEFGHPWELLQNESGMLRALVEESGDRDVLYTLASSARP